MHYAILGPIVGKLVVSGTGEGSEGDAIGRLAYACIWY